MADLDLRGRTLGEFVLREPIGEGGYGVVYRSAQPLLERDVVVKVLRERPGSNDDARERFLREAKLASRLDHPYAAHVYAFGVEPEDSLLWIAMELVRGITFAAWLRERGPMPLEQLVPFFDRVAEVVHSAHERGIIHRDLKPSNVMVIERGGRLIPKLLDFGIAKVYREAARVMPETCPDDSVGEADAPAAAPGTGRVVTRTDPEAKNRGLTPLGAGIGSSVYMSPEQWANASDVGPASDIYSLGVLAYEALTGRVPCAAASEREYNRRRRKTRVSPFGGDLPPALDRVFQRALSEDPDARHGSALELASALQAALRASQRELLRSSAQQWDDHDRTPALLLGGKVLAGVERLTRGAPAGVLSELECSFIAASQRRARRFAWGRRLAGALVVTLAFGAVLYQTAMQTRSAQRVAEATITQSELEQGQSALLHGEPEAQQHLAEAYRRGDHSLGTAFMLARALQPLRAEQGRFAAMAGHMWSAAFSPDGRQVVTTDDACARIWDARTNQLMFTLQHGDTVYDARYSTDGARLVTASGDGGVRIWNASTSALVHTLKHQRADGKPSRYFVAAVSPDGRLVAAIDTAGAVAHVWDAASGAPLAELRNDASDFPSIAFSADSRWLATSGGDDARVFDTHTWAQVLMLAGPRIRALSFDPMASRLVTGSAGGDATIWKIPSGARAKHLREVGAPVRAVAFSPDGQLVATGGGDGAAQVWDASSGALRNQINAARTKILSIEFDPTSKLVVVAGDGGAVVVAEALGMPVTVLDVPRGVVRTAHFDPTSHHVVGASWDGTARVWDATSPYRRWSSLPVAADCGLVTSLEPDQRFIAIGCWDRNTRVWDTARDGLLAELPSVTPVDGDFASAFPAVSSAGDLAAIARGNTVEIYALPGRRLQRTIRHSAAVNAVAFAPAGHDLVSGATDGSLLVTRDGRESIALPVFPGGIDAAGFLPDGRVVAADARRRLRVYDTDRGAVLADLAVPTRVRLLRPSPDGLTLITIPSFTGKAIPPVLWDLARYRLVAQLEGHVGRAFSARYVDRGHAIVTVGADGAARLWNSETGQLLSVYRSTSLFLADAVVTSDGAMVIAGGSDGLLWFWDRATTRLLWKLQAHSSDVVGIHLEGDQIVTRGFAADVSRWALPKPEQVIEAMRPKR